MNLKQKILHFKKTKFVIRVWCPTCKNYTYHEFEKDAYNFKHLWCNKCQSNDVRVTMFGTPKEVWQMDLMIDAENYANIKTGLNLHIDGFDLSEVER